MASQNVRPRDHLLRRHRKMIVVANFLNAKRTKVVLRREEADPGREIRETVLLEDTGNGRKVVLPGPDRLPVVVIENEEIGVEDGVCLIHPGEEGDFFTVNVTNCSLQ